MKNRASFLIGLPGVLGLTIGTTNAFGQEQAEVLCTLGGSAVAGMVIHIDPHTGRPTSRPMPEQSAALAALQAARANRSTKGLVQEVGPTGGVKVDLRNRFRSPLVAVKHNDGGVQVDHLSCKPAGDGS